MLRFDINNILELVRDFIYFSLKVIINEYNRGVVACRPIENNGMLGMRKRNPHYTVPWLSLFI